MTVTYSPDGDRGDLERIYDRLRKRSYRRMKRAAVQGWPFGDVWMDEDHDAYVDGLRDGLTAVKEICE